MKLRIAFLQIQPTGTLSGNLEKGIRYCREAAENKADIALFPEMWSNGYNIYDRLPEEWKNDAVCADSDFVNEFGRLSKELNMAIAVTFLERIEAPDGNGLNPRNSVALFDRFGDRRFLYAKVHTCAFDVEKNLTPGNNFFVTTLNTVKGNIEAGAMICYDREFPESARALMLKGAEVVLVPNACPMEINRLSQLRGRAYENMMAVATCNYPAGVPDCNGGSSCFDGVAYVPSLKDSRDTCILQAGTAEGIYYADIDIDMLRDYRAREVHGNAYRRVDIYDILTKDLSAPDVSDFMEFYGKVVDAVNKTEVRLGWNTAIYPDETFICEALEKHELIYKLDHNKRIIAAAVVNNRVNDEYALIDWCINGPKEKIATIHALAVAPSVQGCGIASSFLQDILKKCREDGYEAVHLDVIDTNEPALKLYLRNGFALIKEIEMYYKSVGTRHFSMMEYIL